MSSTFPSGLYAHNQYAIEAGIEDDLPLVDIDRMQRKLAIPQKTELIDFLATYQFPQRSRKLVKVLIKLGATATFPVTDGVRDFVAVGVFDLEKYIKNYNRGIKYRCVAHAIDPVVIVPETGAKYEGDWKRLTRGYSTSKKLPRRKAKDGKGLGSPDYLRRVVDNTFEAEWKDVCAASRAVIPTLKNTNADRKFWAPTLALAKETIDRSDVPERRYMAERFDCDDFARTLQADFLLSGITAVGVVYCTASRHAFNAVVYYSESARSLRCVFIEPQTDDSTAAIIKTKQGQLFIEKQWVTPKGEIRW